MTGRIINGKIDLTDPNNLSDKVVDEANSRKKWLSFARSQGFEKDLLLLFAKFDNLLKQATDPKEKMDIAKLGALEVYKLLNGGLGYGDLTVNGEVVYKGK